MIARVALDLALRKEFDYAIPPQLEGLVRPGVRVKVPFGSRQILGSVTALLEKSTHEKLKPILKVLGEHALITPKVFELAAWISDYYCCSLDATLKAVLPESVRQEEPGWRERLVVRLRDDAPPAKLTARQAEILELLREKKSAPLVTFLKKAKTTAGTLRKLEELHLLEIVPEISERDPYAN